MKPYEWMVAFRYLRARRAEGFISVIAGFSLAGIMLGVATLIVVMAVMNGFRAELLGRIVGMKGHVVAYARDGALVDYDRYAEEFRKIDGVKFAMPLVEGQVMVTASGQRQGTARVSNNGGRLGIASGATASGAMVTGIRPEDLEAKPLLVDNIYAGSLDDFKAGGGVMIGARMAERLGIRAIGDQVMLISPEGRQTFAGLMPRIKSYPVVAIFNVGMYEYDSGMVFMPFDEAQSFFMLSSGETKAASNLELVLTDMSQAEKVANDLQQRYVAILRIRDWQQINSHFFNALQVERNVMFLILSLIIMVAAFNIISSMIMLVKDKGRDIGILRTMGASRGEVLRIFFVCGSSIGIIGTVLGVALGLAFSLNIDAIKQWLEGLTNTELFAAEIYYLAHLPAIVDPKEVVHVVIMALSLSVLATIYPALRAARLDPAEALRYE